MGIQELSDLSQLIRSEKKHHGRTQKKREVKVSPPLIEFELCCS